MAINTYSDLKTQLQNWLSTTETTFVASIDEIIRLGELKAQRDLDLEEFKKNATGTLTASSRALTLPSDYIKPSSLSITVGTSYVPLMRRTKDYLDFYSPDTSVTGQPKYWATDSDGSLYLAPTPGSNYAYTLRYLARLPALTVTTQETNWLTENVPDLLFYACIVEAQRFIDAPEDAAPWVSAYYDEKLPSAEMQYLGEARNRYQRMKPTPQIEERS